jgi:DNA-binding CsgD family transcriptional regulator
MCNSKTSSGGGGLSSAERRVLRLAAAGLPTGEVARHLGMSVETVQGHLRTAIRTLGAGSKLEAIIIAIRRGIIDPPSAAR